LPLAAVPHALHVAQKAMTGMWITSSPTAAGKLGGCEAEHQIEKRLAGFGPPNTRHFPAN
jgi:hypothetical protein